MKCPNCRSSRVRRAKRTIGEKIFLSMLLARPFRCEDCIHRYFNFLWASGSNLAGVIPDAKSLVYRSSTAALHSADHKHRGARRKVYSDGPERVSGVIAAPAAASMSKPVQQSLRQKTVQGNGLPMRENPKPKSEFFPEILGIILEIKQQTS
jgi:hypothetical protein